jgi:hypothetical protein
MSNWRERWGYNSLLKGSLTNHRLPRLWYRNRSRICYHYRSRLYSCTAQTSIADCLFLQFQAENFVNWPPHFFMLWQIKKRWKNNDMLSYLIYHAFVVEQPQSFTGTKARYFITWGLAVTIVVHYLITLSPDFSSMGLWVDGRGWDAA